MSLPRTAGRVHRFLRTVECALLLAALVVSPTRADDAPAADVRLTRPDTEGFPDLFGRTDTCNVYVLRDGDAAILIDLGNGSVLDRLGDIGVKRVEWVLFTHHHREQCQGIGRLDRSVTKVAVPKEERDLFETPNAFRKWYPKLGDRYSVYGASYVRPPRAPIAVDRALADGEAFRWKDYEITCLSTPGHSPGSATYVVRRGERTFAFSGGVMHDGSKMTTWFDTEWDYGFGKGIDVLAKSVDRLFELDADVLLPSHGPVVDDPAKQLAKYREKLDRFRAAYVRGYPVFDATDEQRDPLSQPTKMPHLRRVTPHLYKLDHHLKGKNFAIIVSDNGRGLVLDCGLFPEETLDEIVAGLRAHAGLKEIDAFWISHMHGDHFLLGPALKRKYGAKAWTLDRIVDRCEHPRRYDYAALVSAYGDGFDGMTIEKPFRDGETVEWEGYTIHVDWMPGQTEFGCCLWLELDGKRIAFTGDNLFGSPSDPKQTGHEAVVARNSAILEEGYVQGSKYLVDLKPDIVMGSHSYVMPDPAAFLDRYHAWSKRMVTLYEEMLPGEHYEYGFDPYWVSAYPYRVDFTAPTRAGRPGQATNTAPTRAGRPGQATQAVQITIRNFRDEPQRHHVALRLPTGLAAEPAILEGELPARGRKTYEIKLTVDRERLPAGVQIVPFDITLDGKPHGELFDFLVLGHEAE